MTSDGDFDAYCHPDVRAARPRDQEPLLANVIAGMHRDRTLRELVSRAEVRAIVREEIEAAMRRLATGALLMRALLHFALAVLLAPVAMLRLDRTPGDRGGW